jgi:cyclic-di-GMP phosphodiesterase TipF (flagellum assembly factor)
MAEMTVALWLVAGGGLALAAVAAMRVRRLSRQAAKLSSDLDTVSQRLLRLEAAPLQALMPVEPRSDGALVDGAIEEVTAEIGLVGEIVRDLAVAVAAHDRDLAGLKDMVGRRTPSVAADPVPPVRPPPAAAPVRAAAAADRPALPIPKAHEPPEAPEERPVAAIVAAFEAERLELHLQPVVALPQRKVRLYEALARLRLEDGTLLVPAEFLPVLEARGLMPDLDRKVLARSAAIARHLSSRGSEASVACNLSPASLAEPGFLRAVARLVEAHPDLPGRLVLELSQRCWRTLDAEKAGALAQLRDRGLVFALDRATDLRLDPLSLADRGVRYVKIPAEMLLAAQVPRGLDVELHDLAAVLARAGIKLVAERVEREEDVPDLLDLDVPMAQGFVFSPPRPLRAEILSPASAPAPAAPAAIEVPVPPAELQPAPEPPQRMPFRSVLRRAS